MKARDYYADLTDAADIREEFCKSVAKANGHYEKTRLRCIKRQDDLECEGCPYTEARRVTKRAMRRCI
jgi:hypothetical protein